MHAQHECVVHDHPDTNHHDHNETFQCVATAAYLNYSLESRNRENQPFVELCPACPSRFLTGAVLDELSARCAPSLKPKRSTVTKYLYKRIFLSGLHTITTHTLETTYPPTVDFHHIEIPPALAPSLGVIQRSPFFWLNLVGSRWHVCAQPLCLPNGIAYQLT